MTELFYHGIYVLISFAHGFSMFLYVIQNILDIPFVYFWIFNNIKNIFIYILYLGVDDALAILLALFSPQDCKIEAITTVSGDILTKIWYYMKYV